MLKITRVPEKTSEQMTVLVERETAEKLEKQTYSDAIKYLLDHHVVFPPELTSRIEELIKNSQLGYRFQRRNLQFYALSSLVASRASRPFERVMVFIDGGYLREKWKNF